MAFRLSKIVGNGLPQEVFTNDVITEAVIHNLIAYNNTSSDSVIRLSLNSVDVLVENVTANSTFRLTDKINTEGGVKVELLADAGVDITICYLQQSVDASAALTLSQQAVVDATAQAALAANAVPSGAIEDDSTATNRVWSASKTEAITNSILTLALAGI